MALLIGVFWFALAKGVDKAIKEPAASFLSSSDSLASQPHDYKQEPLTGSNKQDHRPGKTQQTTNEGGDWVDAERFTARQGEVCIAVTLARVGRIPLAQFREEGTSKENLLAIDVRISNSGQTHKIDYRTWGHDGFDLLGSRSPQLHDNFKNRYRGISFGFGTEVVGQVKDEAIYPGKWLDDVLVFERPLENIQYLRLELPASAFGGKGAIRFQIPARLITKDPNAEKWWWRK